RVATKRRVGHHAVGDLQLDRGTANVLAEELGRSCIPVGERLLEELERAVAVDRREHQPGERERRQPELLMLAARLLDQLRVLSLPSLEQLLLTLRREQPRLHGPRCWRRVRRGTSRGRGAAPPS